MLWGRNVCVNPAPRHRRWIGRKLLVDNNFRNVICAALKLYPRDGTASGMRISVHLIGSRSTGDDGWVIFAPESQGPTIQATRHCAGSPSCRRFGAVNRAERMVVCIWMLRFCAC